eukprot:g12367.t1
MSAAESAASRPKRKNLTTPEKKGMVAELLKGSTNGVLSHGDFKRVAAMYQQTPKTVSKYWKMYNQKKEAGEQDPDLHNKRKGNSGQKGLDIAALKEALQEIQLKNRTTIRSIAAASDIPKSTLFDDLKNLGLRSCSRFLKPLLSDDGKAQRLAWALRWVRSSPGGARKFHHFFDFVHLDEKWFYICKQRQRYYLYEGEDLPIRKVQHKSHVIKVMFLAAVARPRYDSGRNRQFDGKIGIYPFTVQRAAQRNSRNRAAGTMVTHSVETSNRFRNGDVALVLDLPDGEVLALVEIVSLTLLADVEPLLVQVNEVEEVVELACTAGAGPNPSQRPCQPLRLPIIGKERLEEP